MSDLTIVPPEGAGRISTLDAHSHAAALVAPFDAKEIEWRVARSGIKNGKPWAMVLAYINNRAIMDRLDQVVGPENWKNEFTRWGDKGVMCGLSVRLNGEWVTKWDGAEETDIESVKGGLSSAMKRAAVQWGIGRYLYGLEEGFATFADRGAYSAKIDGQYFKWDPPSLPGWALPTGRDRVVSTSATEANPQGSPKSKDATSSPGPLSDPPPALQTSEPLNVGGPIWHHGSKRGTSLSVMRDEELTLGRQWLVKRNKTGEMTGQIEDVDRELKRRQSKEVA